MSGSEKENIRIKLLLITLDLKKTEILLLNRVLELETLSVYLLEYQSLSLSIVSLENVTFLVIFAFFDKEPLSNNCCNF